MAAQYRDSRRVEKTRILDEFASITGHHRKYAMRLLRAISSEETSASRPERRVYDEAARAALIVLWEASNRICGKRLKAMIPTLVPAMERHGYLDLAPEIRAALLSISAATIDRAFGPQRERIGSAKRRRGSPSALQRSIPVRTFSDWNDPVPGFIEVDLVAHSGPSASGCFIQTLVLTDIATGWTECAPRLVREQMLLVGVLREMRARMPFPLLGFDSDNDSVFINETVRDYCLAEGIEFTRSRPYRKNDQAHVEQKKGAIVRRSVGHQRFEGMAAARELAALYARTRLFVNAFQPSFKLAEKERDGARVGKRYHAPATPCDRLLADPRTSEEIRHRVEAMRASSIQCNSWPRSGAGCKPSWRSVAPSIVTDAATMGVGAENETTRPGGVGLHDRHDAGTDLRLASNIPKTRCSASWKREFSALAKLCRACRAFRSGLTIRGRSYVCGLFGRGNRPCARCCAR